MDKADTTEDGVFFGYEYLTLWTLSKRPSLRLEFINSFGASNKALPWFMNFVLTRQGSAFKALIADGCLEGEEKRDEEEEEVALPQPFLKNDFHLISSYLSMKTFTEFYLDNIFAEQNDPPLTELFKAAPHLRVLSLKFNNLRRIPTEIGRLADLERLHLTNNSLRNFTIPSSLAFCHKLKDLYLDNNYLDALPGFLLKMSSLQTLHRHGNNDYFKSTFMWYHMALHGRITMDMRDQMEDSEGQSSASLLEEEESSADRSNKTSPKSLKSLCVKRVISFSIPYFQYPLPESVKDDISSSYDLFNICDNCGSPLPKNQLGYQVYTFKNPYLGNTCVPFLHWSCSYECGLSIEGPARAEQQTAALEQDKRYQDYIRGEEAANNTTSSSLLRSSSSTSALLSSHKSAASLKSSLWSLNSIQDNHHHRRSSRSCSAVASSACTIL